MPPIGSGRHAPARGRRGRGGWGRRLLRSVVVILLLLVASGAILAVVFPEWAQYLGRCVAWGESDVMDYQRFPAREIANGSPVFNFKENSTPELFRRVVYSAENTLKE